MLHVAGRASLRGLAVGFGGGLGAGIGIERCNASFIKLQASGKAKIAPGEDSKQ